MAGSVSQTSPEVPQKKPDLPRCQPLLYSGKQNWGKESIHRLAPVQNFSLPRKNGVHREKISVVDMVFLVFIGFLYPPPAWKVFLLGQKSSPKDFLSVVVVYAFFFSAKTHTNINRST